MNKEQFAECPFCGKSETLTIGKASDAFAEPDECGDPMPYMHTESYAVTCDASKPDGPGGCGASGGYKLTEDEAIAAWNRRAEVERLAEQAGPAPAPKKCNRCNGTGLVSDGAIYGSGGVEYENGPVLCVKDCPDCGGPQPAPARADNTEFYLSGPYPSGAYGICEVSTCRIRHIFNPATDDYQGRMNTPAPVGEYPPLPEPDYWAYKEQIAYYTNKTLHAYLDADRAQRPAREVRLLTPQEIVEALVERLNSWDLKDPREILQRKFCEVNGLTIREQS